VEPVMREVPQAAVSSDGVLLDVPVNEVDPNPHQPRREFDQGALDELAVSVRENGVIQPIVVRRANDRYQLIAGERRLRAAKMAGLAKVPAVVREVDGLNQAQQALVENVQRADLNPIERAEAYRVLVEQLGLTQSELATRIGEDRSIIANHLRLLTLSEAARDLVRMGKLTLGHAKVLAGVEDKAEQDRLASLAAQQELSVRNLERLVRGTPPPPRQQQARAAHLGDLEERIRQSVGLRAQVQGRQGGKGKLVLHYGSLEEFDDLMRRMGVPLDGD
jgi:ParB family chromosome partitioning protein